MFAVVVVVGREEVLMFPSEEVQLAVGIELGIRAAVPRKTFLIRPLCNI